MKENFKIFNFNKVSEAPKNTPNKKDGFVSWGLKNDYPQYLMDLYNHKGSGVHKSIINRKVKMIAGQGIENLERRDDKLRVGELCKRLALDYELYNAYAIEVVYSNGGDVVELNHISIARLRAGIVSEEINFKHFWYSTNWNQYKKEEHKPQFIREFNPLIKQGRQLYYYQDYNPDTDVYPTNYYSNEINWIELDYEISKFHLNQAKNGYAPQFVLNFATGIPDEEQMDDIVRNFKREYKGTSGETMMITFSEGGEQKPELIPIALNDSDERFVNLAKEVKENIFIGHEITNPQLFGVRVAGELGGKNELVESLEIFQAIYVNQRQNDVEYGINEILGTDYKLNKFEI